MSSNPKNTTPAEGKSPIEAPEPQKGIGETTRSKTHEVLAAGPNPPPPNEPEAKKPSTREQLIYGLGLRSQWEIRSDHMVSLIEQDVFGLGKPFPSLDATLNSFTTEQLELASTLQEPTLLLVPETSFAAKVKALDAAKTMFMDEEDESKRQRDCYVDDIYRKTDSGSNIITGWKALIVEGAEWMAIKDGDPVGLALAERLRNRNATGHFPLASHVAREQPVTSDVARRPGDIGMDRHTYAMLMLELFRFKRPVDRHSWTLLDGDPANSDVLAPFAGWDPVRRMVVFDRDYCNRTNIISRFRYSVGGDVEL